MGTAFFQVVFTQKRDFSHTHMVKSNNPCGSYSHSEVGYRNPGQKEAEGWGEVCVARVFFFFKFKGCVFREKQGGRFVEKESFGEKPETCSIGSKSRIGFERNY